MNQLRHLKYTKVSFLLL